MSTSALFPKHTPEGKTTSCHVFLLLFPLLLLFPATSFGQLDTYGFQRELLQVRTNGYHEVRLPLDLLTRLNDDLADVRLYQLSGYDSVPAVEIPFLMERKEQVRAYEERQLSMINEATRKDFSQIILRKEEEGEINRIELEIEPRNFDVQASLEGSDNRLKWLMIEDDIRLLGISNQDVTYQHARLNFSPSDYRFFRIRLSDPSVQVSKASLRYWRETEGEYQPYEIKDWQVSNNTSEKTTEIQVELAGRYPVSRLQFQIASKRDYFRPARITYVKQRVETEEGSRDIWRDLADMTLSSMEEAEVYAPLQFTDAIKVVIQNQDNLPLDIQAVQLSGPAFHLIAELEREAQYVLAYDKASASVPRYDLVHFRDKILQERLVPASLGAETVISQDEQDKADGGIGAGMENLLLWIVMGVVIAVLGAITVRMITKAK
jgi:hypothetical protein